MSSVPLTARLCDAFTAHDADAFAALFDTRGLFEFPLVGQRLIGRDEIRAAAERMFAVASDTRLAVTATRVAAGVAISEGQLDAAFADSRPSFSAPLSIVVEGDESVATRISIYVEAHRQRLWVDGPVFAAG